MKKFVFLFSYSLLLVLLTPVLADASKQRIYDEANLLTDQEVERLEALAAEHGEIQETDFIIVTSPDGDGKDIVRFVQDFYDEMAFGYDKPHGNTAILALNMSERDVYLAGFYRAEEYLNDERLNLIREQITPDLSKEDYFAAFSKYIETASRYMNYVPGFNPESILFQTWFHILLAIGVGALVVGAMAYNSGGRVTVNERTYTEDFKVLERKDIFLRKSVTRRRKPKNNSSGGGGGGGISRGGHSHSGSRGKF